MQQPRERPLHPSTGDHIKRVMRKFETRRLNEIPPGEWTEWIDGDPGRSIKGICSDVKSSTRERTINAVLAFLNFCKKKHGLVELPVFTRDRKATSPTRRARRPVDELRPDLIRTLLNECHIATRAQLAIECDTGARVSSILHGARLSDIDLARTRGTIVFRNTKPGHDVSAALGPTAVRILKEYLVWRGNLHDRDAKLFLTPAREPYTNTSGRYGAQNKTAFQAARRRACRAIRDRAAAAAWKARRRGNRAAALEAIAVGKADARLLGRVTQHWFRHRLATIWLRKDPRAAMDQGGWLDIKSLMGYAHSVPAWRQEIAAELDLVGSGGRAKRRARSR